ncbi:SH3 domain-containing protein [Amphritea sp.]|uniref:SH3 domain-containing protein n=1 Tax=Amphritea sp. TaxID=1872502 RepID=UPI0025C024B3|nr:SH3 domain-containing protein [Amphritea sp.]
MKATIVKSALLAFLCLFSFVSHAFEYFVVNQTAKVFSAPDSHKVLTQLSKGSFLLEIDKQGTWSKVFFLTAEKQALKGWILSEHLSAQQQGASQPVSEDSGKYYTVAVNVLRLRRGPGGDQPIVGGLKRDQMVKQLHREGKWVKVRYRNESGNTAQAWTASQFLKSVKVMPEGKTSNLASTQLLTEPDAGNGLFRVKGTQVNFRSGPGVEYRVIGQLSKPQQVEVIASQGEWKKIRVDPNGKDVTGWIIERLLEPR